MVSVFDFSYDLNKFLLYSLGYTVDFIDFFCNARLEIIFDD